MAVASSESLSPAANPVTARPHITVIYTASETTQNALRIAGRLAACLPARITLLIAQIWPYPVPLKANPVAVERAAPPWVNHRETDVRVCMCHDRQEGLTSVLEPHSFVVIGVHSHFFWRSSEEHLLCEPRRAGHEVLLAR